ncbi:unnamed protein product [Scytosiphon promiscuus]
MRPETELKLARRQQTQQLLKWLYSTRDAKLDGTKLSMEYRARLEGDTKPLTYGEVHVPDFLSILELVKPKDGEIFVDLGSGTGKAVLAAACGFPEFSKYCMCIELVPGLADAAAEHLSAAKTLLASLQAPVADVAPTMSTTATKLRSDMSTAPVLGPLRKVCQLKKAVGKTPRSKAASQGLSAGDLEALIAELLVRHASLSPLQVVGARSSRHGDDVAVSPGSRPAATAEEVAAWLVRQLGHRRQVDGYKSSLRGYGGLQKFLVARREASDVSSRLLIAEDGAGVAIARADTCAPSDGHESVPDHGKILPVDEETAQRREGVVGQESSFLTLSRSGSICLQANAPDAKRLPMTTSGVTEEYRDGGRSGAGSRGEINVDRRRLWERGPLTVESLSGVELACRDIFQEAWDDAGVVYVASLLFDDSMMALLAEYTQKLRKGARIISLKPIPALGLNEDVPIEDARLHATDAGVRRGGAGGEVAEGCNGLKLLHEGFFQMSWQMARVYIYER